MRSKTKKLLFFLDLFFAPPTAESRTSRGVPAPQVKNPGLDYVIRSMRSELYGLQDRTERYFPNRRVTYVAK